MTLRIENLWSNGEKGHSVMSTLKDYVQGIQHKFHSMIIRDKQNLCVRQSQFLSNPRSASKSIYI